MKTKAVFSTKMVNYLLKSGATLLHVASDKKNRDKLVFHFEDNEKLIGLINNYPH
ncbi:DUF5659 domain-containing protein [Bacillus sp. PK5-004]